jgi:hypothetical protein
VSILANVHRSTDGEVKPHSDGSPWRRALLCKTRPRFSFPCQQPGLGGRETETLGYDLRGIRETQLSAPKTG